MPRSANQLLRSLPDSDYRRIAPALHTLHLSNGSTLAHCGVSRVYFPGSAMCSVLRRMVGGTSIEVASVGSEGAVGLPALGSQLTPDTYLQVSHGTVQYMSMAVFTELCSRSELGAAIDRYCAAFTEAVVRLAGCNQMHVLEARCARWLAMAHERLGRANFELSQPFLAMALGANRDDLAKVLTGLKSKELINYNTATFTIIDRIGLARAACPCYRVLKQNLHRRDAATLRPSEEQAAGGNVLAMRAVALCTLCGLSRHHPHKTHAECLRALDEELRSLILRARQLNDRRAAVAHESLRKFEKIIARRS